MLGGDDILFCNFIQNISCVTNVFDIVTPLRLNSLTGAKIFNDKSIQFCFIDAGHSYEEVLADINAWYPKVKIGGIIAGHDYDESNPDAAGVCNAVKHFFNEDYKTRRHSWIHEVKK